MSKYALFLFLVSAPLWGQAYTFPNVNNDLAVHQFTMPIPCPSTNSGDCAGNPSNSALNGHNSVFAECDFATSGGINNPDCGGHGNQVVASTTANAITNSQYTYITRATDFTDGSTWYATQNGAQMADNSWDSTSTRLILGNSSHTYTVFSFDPDPAHTTTYLHATKLYGSNTINSITSWFSRQPSSTFVGGQTVSYWYSLLRGDSVPGFSGVLTAGHVYITRWDFSDATTFPSLANGKITVVKDLTSSGCLGSSYDNSGNTRPNANGITVSYDDNYFLIPTVKSGCSGGGGAPACTLVTNGSIFNLILVYSKSANACSVWDTNAGTVTNPSGTTSNILDNATGANFTNNTTGDGSPNFFTGGLLYIEENYCLPVSITGPCHNTAATNTVRHVWETGFPYPGNSNPTGFNAWRFGNASHRAAGFSHFMTYPGENGVTYEPQFMMTYNSNNQTSMNSGTVAPQNICFHRLSTTSTNCAHDDHKSWVLNTSTSDNAPMLGVTSQDTIDNTTISNSSDYGPQTPNNVPWSFELLLWPTSCYPSCSNNKPWRVAHTFNNSNLENTFNATGSQAYDYSKAISSAAISPLPVHGHIFIAWTGLWQGQLGCQGGTYDTTAPAGGIGLGCPANNPPRSDVFIAAVPVTNPQTFYFFWHI